ncbi:MAG: hypothetical protein KJT03_14300, partial [Verrucomicrobiae bacterium]|nr:hypothetical protein [Verrucomicrobiae bacterium]
ANAHTKSRLIAESIDLSISSQDKSFSRLISGKVSQEPGLLTIKWKQTGKEALAAIKNRDLWRLKPH